jgi:four helix bundle protein
MRGGLIGAMTEGEMKRRTKDFSLRILQLVEDLPETRTARIIANQLARAGTSVATNYRAVCRAKSSADVVAKVTTVEEEADECAFWLELLSEAGLMAATQTGALLQEAGELTAIMVASRKTLLARIRK